MTFAPVDHFNDRVYDCRIDRPRQNGRSRCRANDDVWIAIGTGWRLLRLFWCGSSEVIIPVSISYSTQSTEGCPAKTDIIVVWNLLPSERSGVET